MVRDPATYCLIRRNCEHFAQREADGLGRGTAEIAGARIEGDDQHAVRDPDIGFVGDGDPHRADALAKGIAGGGIGCEAVEAARRVLHGVEGQRPHRIVGHGIGIGLKPDLEPARAGKMGGVIIGSALNLR